MANVAKVKWTPWRVAGLALALDILFVALWWTMVYMPGDSLVAPVEAGRLRWGDEVVTRVRILAPGTHALVRAGQRWHLLDAESLQPGDLSPAAAAPGSITGDLGPAVYVDALDAAVIVGLDGDAAVRAWRWPLGEGPISLSKPPAQPWIDARGALQDRHELEPKDALDGLHYAADFMVVTGDERLSVLSRDDGKVLHEQGKVERGFPRPESPQLVYETHSSSLPYALQCAFKRNEV